MLRVLVVFLLLANLAFYAWTQGWLTSITGVGPQGDRDPARLQRQVRPEVVRVLPPEAASAAPAASGAETTTSAAAATTALACLDAGPYSATDLPQAETVLKAALPAGAWSVLNSERPGVWLIYMGKYANREAMDKKVGELKRFSVNYEEVRNSPDLELGLALGRYDNRSLADERLAELVKRGIRTARVINITPPAPMHTLRVLQADGNLQRTLNSLKDKLPGTRGFAPCPAGV